MKTITEYTGEYEFLNLEYPVNVCFLNHKYTSVREALTAIEKSRFLNKVNEQQRCKRMTNFLANALKWKFCANPELRDKLLATGDAVLADNQSEFASIVNTVMMAIRENLRQGNYLFIVCLEEDAPNLYFKSIEAVQSHLAALSEAEGVLYAPFDGNTQIVEFTK